MTTSSQRHRNVGLCVCIDTLVPILHPCVEKTKWYWRFVFSTKKQNWYPNTEIYLSNLIGSKYLNPDMYQFCFFQGTGFVFVRIGFRVNTSLSLWSDNAHVTKWPSWHCRDHRHHIFDWNLTENYNQPLSLISSLTKQQHIANFYLRTVRNMAGQAQSRIGRKLPWSQSKSHVPPPPSCTPRLHLQNPTTQRSRWRKRGHDELPSSWTDYQCTFPKVRPRLCL